MASVDNQLAYWLARQEQSVKLANLEPSSDWTDYSACLEWNRNTGSPRSWAEGCAKEAAKDRAPRDAIYKSDGTWHTLRDLAVDHPARISWERKNGVLPLDKRSHSLTMRDEVAPAAVAALDLLTRRHARPFNTFLELCNAAVVHGYRLRLVTKVKRDWDPHEASSAGERLVLADAFNDAMDRVGCPTRCDRS